MISSQKNRLKGWLQRLIGIGSIAVLTGGCVGAEEEWSDGAEAEATSETSQAIELGARRHRISGGSNHWLAIGRDGVVWSWGYNGNGQLGDGATSTAARTSPLAVINLTNAVSVAAGGAHSLAVRSTGRVWAWGSNGNGQLGDGTTNQQATPVQIGITDVVTVAAGQSHSLALKNDGTVWAWGANSYGQLGNGLTGSVQTTPVQVLRNDNGAPLTNIVAIAAGMYHSVAVRADGTVWTWGYNYFGQLGNGTTATSTRAVSVASLTGAVAIAAGQYHTAALLANGAVKTWGWNGTGQLGNNDATLATKLTPQSVAGIVDAKAIAAGSRHTMVVKADGSVMAWGYGYMGQIGNNNTTNQIAPAPVSSLVGTSEIGGGAYSSCALLGSGGGIRCWGTNAYGELGNGNTSQSNVPTTTNTLSGLNEVAAGEAHSVAVKWDGTVWSWGQNIQGQLGDGSIVKRLSPIQVRLSSAPTYLDNVTAVAAGQLHSVALRSDGTVWAWGDNDFGQCGDGTITVGVGAANRFYPVQVRQNGGAFLTGIVAIRSGSHFSMALRFDGKVFAWGRNQFGQLGMANGGLINQGFAQEVQYLDNVVALAAGGAHAVAITSDGSAYGWGSNSDGQLGCDPALCGGDLINPFNGASFVSVAAGTLHTLLQRSDGSVYGCGDNMYGQLGTGNNADQWDIVPVNGLSNAIRIAAGGHHSLAMTSDGLAYACGRNDWGQLGNGGTTNQNLIGQIPSFGLMTGIAAGTDHSMAVKSDGSIWTWGRNNNGQLGNGTQNAAPNSNPAQNNFFN